MSTIENFIVKVTAQGLNNLDKIASGAEKAAAKIDGLAASILGVGFGAFIHGAIEMADRISDLSDATGISINRITAFEHALAASGGKARNMEKAILGFAMAIETANDGSLKARDAFSAVGVSLTDLKNLSEQDLLEKTIKGLARLKEEGKSASEIAALGSTLLTKAFRGVDVQKFFDEYSKGKISLEEMSEKIRKAGEYNDKLEEKFRILQMGALEAIAPIIDAFGNMGITVDGARKLIIGIGVAMTFAFGAKMVANILSLNRAILGTAAVANLLGKNPVVKALAIAALAALEGGAAYTAYEKILKDTEKAQDDLNKTIENSPTPDPGKGDANRPQQQDPRQKAQEESKKRILQSEAEIAKFQTLMAGNVQDEIRSIQENAASDIAKARAEIFAREYLTQAEKEKELAAKRKEINAKADLDIAKVRAEINKQLQDQLTNMKMGLEDKQAQFDLEQKLSTAIGSEALAAAEILDIEKQRKRAIEEAARVKGIDIDQLANQIEAINAVAQAEKDLATQRAEYRRSFETGWNTAYTNFVNNGTNAAKIAGDMFNSVTNNMMGAIDKFVETGKLNFSDLARSIILDLLKIQLKASAVQIFSSLTGQGGALSFLGLQLPGKALGGPVIPGQPYITGEKGPELFIPNTAGSIVPNNKMGKGGGMGGNTYITNNISAIDSKSVAQLFAENRMTLFGTVEQARRELPLRTR